MLGANCIILSHTWQSCEVIPYSDTYDVITDVTVVTGATLWTSPHDGDEFILILNEALWMGDTLQDTLVNPNQLRAYGAAVKDNPFAPSPLKFEPPTGLTIPLTTMGTIIYCNTRAPNDHELSTLLHIHLSSSAAWDPHNVVFPTNRVEEEEHQPQISQISSISLLSSSANDLTSTIHDPMTFHSRLYTFFCLTTRLKQTMVHWPQEGQGYHQNTTQQILHSALLPLARRYRENCMYERPRIRGTVYTDTMDGQHKSLDGNKYTQLFATDFHFSAVYPMESKGLAEDELKQFIADFGVPDKIICDGSKEQTKTWDNVHGEGQEASY